MDKETPPNAPALKEPKPLLDVIAANLIRYLEKHPGQENLEKRGGGSQANISRIKQGTKGVGTINLETLETLARGMGVEPWELLVDGDDAKEAIVRRFVRGDPHG